MCFVACLDHCNDCIGETPITPVRENLKFKPCMRTTLHYSYITYIQSYNNQISKPPVFNGTWTMIPQHSMTSPSFTAC